MPIRMGPGPVFVYEGLTASLCIGLYVGGSIVWAFLVESSFEMRSLGLDLMLGMPAFGAFAAGIDAKTTAEVRASRRTSAVAVGTVLGEHPTRSVQGDRGELRSCPFEAFGTASQ